MIPFTTCEIPLCQDVCKLILGVDVFDLDLGVKINSIEQRIKSNSVGPGNMSHLVSQNEVLDWRTKGFVWDSPKHGDQTDEQLQA